MKAFLVFVALFGLSAASPQYFPGVVASQYRYQDEFGQHAFGHVGGPNSREEVKTADGVTRGSYSYVDSNGLVQSAVYSADAYNGFRVAATNLPVGPAVPGAPVVAKVAAPVVAAPAVVAARLAYPSAVLGAPVVHALKKRDVVAVSHPLTSYPGSTAPLAHVAPFVAAPVAYAAAPVAHVAHPYIAAPAYHVLKKRDAPIVPADEPIVAHAKAAQLIQQNTEAIRNNYGGIPLALPADTPEVAAGKVAHAFAHANQAAVTSARYLAAPYVASPYVAAPYVAAPAASYVAAPAASYVAAPVAPVIAAKSAYSFLY